MKEIMEETYFSDLESKYFEIHNTWKLEESLLFSFSKDELKDLIKSTEISYKQSKLSYHDTLCKKLLKTLFANGNKMDKYFIEQIEYEFHWWKELDQNKQFLNRLKRFYKLNYETSFHERKNIDISRIPIREILWMYMKVPDNLRRNIRCIFPGHKDKSASLKIYENSNSFYCFWCHKWWNIVNLIAEMENISTQKAYKKILDLYW